MPDRDQLNRLLQAVTPKLPPGFRLIHPHEFPAVQQLVRSFTYKPGWSFVLAALNNNWGAPYLVISAQVPDRDRPQSTITVQQFVAVPFAGEDLSRDLYLQWLRSAVVGVEVHEAEEWFKVDGVRVFDPHAKEKPADAAL